MEEDKKKDKQDPKQCKHSWREVDHGGDSSLEIRYECEDCDGIMIEEYIRIKTYIKDSKDEIIEEWK